MLPEKELKERLQKDKGEIAWPELQEHIDRGVVIEVDSSLDLIETAIKFVQDDKDQVAKWLEQGLIKKVESAKSGSAVAVVVAPWVLAKDLGQTH